MSLVVFQCLSVIAGCASWTQAPTTLLRSPAGRFDIVVSGDLNTSPTMGTNEILVTARRDGRLVIDSQQVLQIGFLDRAFVDEFPNTGWDAENILRFSSYDLIETGDTLVVENKSGEAISIVLRVGSEMDGSWHRSVTVILELDQSDTTRMAIAGRARFILVKTIRGDELRGWSSEQVSLNSDFRGSFPPQE